MNDGTALIHVDPRANTTTRLADIHLAPRPGTDALVVALMVVTILDEELFDESFVRERMAGFETFAASVGEIDVEVAAEQTGIDSSVIRKTARAFGEAERAAVVAGTGIEEDGHSGTDTADALLNLLFQFGPRRQSRLPPTRRGSFRTRPNNRTMRYWWPEVHIRSGFSPLVAYH